MEPDSLRGSTAPTHAVEVVTKAAICSVRGQHVVALEASRWSTLTDAEILAEDAEEVERELSDAAVAFLASRLAITRAQTLWVGRYALDATRPAQWAAHGTVSHTLHSGHDALAEPSRIEIGWGNGAVIGWERLGENDRNQLVRGLVDAQCIWAECYSIAKHALDSIQALQEPAGKLVSGRELRTFQKKTETLSAKLVDHHLAFDDLLLNIQGVRSETARTALRAWGYDDVSARIDRRVSDVLQLLQLRRERFERSLAA